MKTIKIIDLLNKIANGEEVPKKVSINGGIHGIDVWEYEENSKDYISSSDVLLLYSGMTSNHLNDEVEILDEENEFENIEELNLDTDELLKKVVITAQDYVIEGKINQLIKNQKKIIERLENIDK